MYSITAIHGAIISFILFFLMLAPFFYLVRIYGDMTIGQKFGASLDLNLAMGFGCIQIARYEAIGTSMQTILLVGDFTVNWQVSNILSHFNFTSRIWRVMKLLD